MVQKNDGITVIQEYFAANILRETASDQFRHFHAQQELCFLGFSGIGRLEDCCLELLRNTVRIENVQLLCEISDIVGSGQQLCQQLLLQIFLIFLYLLLECAELAPMLLFCKDLLTQMRNQRLHRVTIDRFEQEVLHADADAFLCISKILMRSQDHDFYLRILFCHDAAEGQAIHKRHLNVRKYNIGGVHLHEVQRLRAATSLCADRKTGCFPVDAHAKEFPRDRLVIHDQNFQSFLHFRQSSLNMAETV